VGAAWDEVFDHDGELREPYAMLHDSLVRRHHLGVGMSSTP